MIEFLGKVITFILTTIIICVLFLTTYFCLEVLEIINVPEQYSIIKFLDFNMEEVITSVQDYVQIAIDGEPSNTSVKESFVVELEDNTVTTVYLEDEKLFETEESKKNFRYYDQLDEYGKTIYEALETNKEQLKTGCYTFDFGKKFDSLLKQENGEEILNSSFQLAVNSFLDDNPDIFYIDITKIYLLTKQTKKIFSETFEVSIGQSETDYLHEEFDNFEAVNIAVNEVEKVKQEIKQNLPENEYEKIKYVHDYLVENIEYEKEVESYNNYTIYGALVNKKSVCEGYAKAFKYILDDLQIPCVLVFGNAKNSVGDTEYHAWNYVLLDNEWYAVDVTWDDPVIIGFGIVTKKDKYKYFLKGSDSFFVNHTEDGEIINNGNVKYPIISKVDY